MFAVPVKFDVGNFTMTVFGNHEKNLGNLGRVYIFGVSRLLLVEEQNDEEEV